MSREALILSGRSSCPVLPALIDHPGVLEPPGDDAAARRWPSWDPRSGPSASLGPAASSPQAGNEPLPGTHRASGISMDNRADAGAAWARRTSLATSTTALLFAMAGIAGAECAALTARTAHLWAKLDGHWRLMYTQVTRVPE